MSCGQAPSSLTRLAYRIPPMPKPRAHIRLELAIGLWIAITAVPAWAAPSRAEELARARQYWYGGLAWGTASQLWMFVVLYLMVRTGWAGRLRDWTERRIAKGTRYGCIAAFTAIAWTVLVVAEFPFGVYLGFFRERRFGFERQGLGGWLGDWGKSYGLELIFLVLALMLLYWVLGHKGGAGRWGAARSWWRAALRVWVPCVAVMILAVAVEPVFIAPLFYRFTPMRPGPLRTELLRMAHRAGIPADTIYVQHSGQDSSHTNAYVVGMLGTERIVVYDTLLKADTPAEVEFVMAHEMGHYAMHHIWKGTMFGAGVLLGLLLLTFWLYGRITGSPQSRLGYRGLADFAGLPLIALLLTGLYFLASPGVNAYSRRLEHLADAYGLRHCPDPAAAVTSFRKDLRTDLIAPDPPRWVVWWFFNHPPDAERIAFAEQYCRAHGIPVPAAGGPAAVPVSRPAGRSAHRPAPGNRRAG